MPHRFVLRISIACIAVSIATGAVFAQISHSVGLLKGQVTLADGTPLANVPVIIFRGVDRINTTRSTSDGRITSILQPNGMYRFAVSEPGYMYSEDTLNVPALSAYQEFPVHIVLTPLRDGELFHLPQPVFEPRARDIDPAADAELNAIALQLKHDPKLSVSIVVYPDAPIKTKRDAAQKSLVTSRVASMQSYLIGQGVSEDRFSVESVTTMIPAGRFPMPANLLSREKPARYRRGRKKEPEEPSLFPQYVEIMAHVQP